MRPVNGGGGGGGDGRAYEEGSCGDSNAHGKNGDHVEVVLGIG